jgi:hypothetical protein
LAIDFFRSLLGSTTIGLHDKNRMQGIPLEDPEGFLPLLPNSPKGSPKGVVNNEVASEVGTTHSLEGFRIILDSLEAFKLLVNPLLSVVRDPRIL